MKSFIDVPVESDFSIYNIPFGIFKTSSNAKPHIGTAIGNYVLDLSVIDSAGLLSYKSIEKNIFVNPNLNPFFSLGKKACSEIRLAVQNLLKDDNPLLRDNSKLREKAFSKIDDVIMCMPAEIGDYTDFYSSRDHATNVGVMFRGKDNALMPNWLHLPVGYHGRASSVIISGTDIVRPSGQVKNPDKDFPEFESTSQLDIELEMGFLYRAGE